MTPSFRIHTVTDRQTWNAFIASCPTGHFMQTWEWGEFKSHTGWVPIRWALEVDGRLRAGAQVLLRTFRVCPYTFGYIPKGPVVDDLSLTGLAPLFRAICDTLKRRKAVFLRIEPDFPDEKKTHEALVDLGFRPIPTTNQPRCTFLVDLAEGEEALTAKLDRNTRRLIRRSQAEGLRVRTGGREDLPRFYAALEETARIKRLPLHGRDFFETFFQAFGHTDMPRLFFVESGDHLSGSLLVIVYGGVSHHLWAGTTREGRRHAASHLLHWEAIRWAVAHGLRRVDLWGIPDEIAAWASRGMVPSAQKEEGLWGVYRFKKGFGGRIACTVGAYDTVFRPNLYRLVQWLTQKKRSLDALSVRLERIRKS